MNSKAVRLATDEGWAFLIVSRDETFSVKRTHWEDTENFKDDRSVGYLAELRNP